MLMLHSICGEDLIKDANWYPMFLKCARTALGGRYTVDEKFVQRLVKSYDRYLCVLQYPPHTLPSPHVVRGELPTFLHHRYLLMKLVNSPGQSRELVHPTYAIDLVWHAHMMHPVAYRQDCVKYIGMCVWGRAPCLWMVGSLSRLQGTDARTVAG